MKADDATRGLIEAGPCPHGEDLKYLAWAAASRDFGLLVDGIVRPEYFSDPGKLVADWVISRRTEPGAEWPPSYSTLRLQFSWLFWPDLPVDTKGIDPKFAASELLYSYGQ